MACNTIVIIDDEPELLLGLQAAFKRHKLNALLAADGQACLNLIKDLKEPSIFLVDLLMPNLDGWGLIERIREHGAQFEQQHRIFVVSGMANAQTIAHFEDVGYIAKPFRLEDILKKIQPYLE